MKVTAHCSDFAGFTTLEHRMLFQEMCSANSQAHWAPVSTKPECLTETQTPVTSLGQLSSRSFKPGKTRNIVSPKEPLSSQGQGRMEAVKLSALLAKPPSICLDDLILIWGVMQFHNHVQQGAISDIWWLNTADSSILVTEDWLIGGQLPSSSSVGKFCP